MSNHPANLLDTAPGKAARLQRLFLILAGVGLIGALLGLLLDGRQFLFSYLSAFVFISTIPLGMLFFVLLHHVTDAGWSTLIRRIPEQCLTAFPALAALFLPIALGMGKLYPWVHPHDGEEKLVAAKWPFLTVWFFLIWAALCFAAWIGLSRYLRSKSIQQDTSGDPALSLQMRRISPPGLIVFALTLTFAYIQWVMTLQFEWFSTIFGVYVFSGAVLAALALLTVLALLLSHGPLEGLVGSDHLHDLGKLIFAFSVFWAYIAFSQYFLIWYSNVPEETFWYLQRWSGGWRAWSILLPIGNFVLPFVLLMSASAKRSPGRLLFVSTAILIVHWVDAYWMAMPALHPQHAPWASLWIDAACVLLIGGVCGFVVTRAFAAAAWYPIHDPRLAESLAMGHEPEPAAEAPQTR